MPLSRRQRRLYILRVTSFRPLADQETYGYQSLTDLAYDPLPVLVEQACYLQGKSDIGGPNLAGWTTQDIIFTQDVWHFPDEDEDGEPLKLDVNHTFRLVRAYRADGTEWEHPELGTWYQVMGEPTYRSWKAKKLSVYAKKLDNRPLGLEGV